MNFAIVCSVVVVCGVYCDCVVVRGGAWWCVVRGAWWCVVVRGAWWLSGAGVFVRAGDGIV
jgi:hypothetical protein